MLYLVVKMFFLWRIKDPEVSYRIYIVVHSLNSLFYQFIYIYISCE